MGVELHHLLFTIWIFQKDKLNPIFLESADNLNYVTLQTSKEITDFKKR